MQHHGEEEELHAPEVQAVEEVSSCTDMPPLRTADYQDDAREKDHD
jgi:hypothetical protein